jgi:hypothetical protein
MNELDEFFEMFWRSGMVKVNKKKARQIFTKLAKKEEDVFSFTENLIIDIQKRLEIRQLGFSAMHPTTYLNGERWEDDYPEDNAHKQSNQTHSQRQHEQARHALREMESADAGFSTSIIRQIQ